MKRDEVHQCKSCPWRVDCEPDKDIPYNYSIEKHIALKDTITSGMESLRSMLNRDPRRVMACHYSESGDEFPCAGWLYNQIGPGNNIAVRFDVMRGRMPVPKVDGEQHERFENTLPSRGRRS